MNDIEFRGKTKEGKWVYGDLINGNNKYIITEYDKKSWLVTLGYQLVTSCSEVLPETVGQWSGLKDKNGVKIFEGDILGYRNPTVKNIVRFGEYCFNGGEYTNKGVGFYLEQYNHGIKTVQEEGCYFEIGAFGKENIIGNFIDNPELLK